MFVQATPRLITLTQPFEPSIHWYEHPSPDRSGADSLGVSTGESQVRAHLAHVGELVLRVLGADGRRDDDILADLPVDRGGDALLVARLQRVDHAQHLGGVPARRRRVEHDEADRLLGVDDKDRADGEGDALFVDVGQVLRVDHVVEERDFAVRVRDDRELETRLRDVVDVADPRVVARQVVGAQPDHLDPALLEFVLQTRERPQFRRAHGREIRRVAEQDRPRVVDVLVEIHVPLRRFRLEVRRRHPQAEARLFCRCGSSIPAKCGR